MGTYGLAPVDQSNPRPPCPADDDLSSAHGDVYCLIRDEEPPVSLAGLQ